MSFLHDFLYNNFSLVSGIHSDNSRHSKDNFYLPQCPQVNGFTNTTFNYKQ